jgi:hypothetical protein
VIPDDTDLAGFCRESQPSSKNLPCLSRKIGPLCSGSTSSRVIDALATVGTYRLARNLACLNASLSIGVGYASPLVNAVGRTFVNACSCLFDIQYRRAMTYATVGILRFRPWIQFIRCFVPKFGQQSAATPAITSDP